MLRLLIVVCSIALGDSLNPSTEAPGLYLATTNRPRRQLLGFITGILVVNVVAGLAIMLGPGQLLSLIPRPSDTQKNVIELVGGVVILILAAIAWLRRKALSQRDIPTPKRSGGSSFALGAGIAAIELPTALPYFAAIALIAGSGSEIWMQVTALLAFNLVFLSPLIALLIAVEVLGSRAQAILKPANRWLHEHWPVLLAALGLLVGAFLLAYGSIELATS